MGQSDNLEADRHLANSRRLLIAEDEIIIRMVIAEALRDDGWEVVETSTADEALDALDRDADFDLLLTDVHMPGNLTGLDLAGQVRQRYGHIRIAVMSGQHRPDGKSPQAWDLFLGKPVWNIVEALSPLVASINDRH